MNCPSCTRENPDSARFCGLCGQSLTAQTPPPELTAPPTVANETELADQPRPQNEDAPAVEVSDVTEPETNLPTACAECGQLTEGEFCISCGASQQAQTIEDAETAPQVPLDPEAVRKIMFLSAPSMPVAVKADSDTHIGVVKDTNEDTGMARTIQWLHHNMQATVQIVADGMGGGPAGEVCAELAANEAWMQIRALLPHAEAQYDLPRYEFWQTATSRIEQGLHGIATAANARVWSHGKQRHFPKEKFGATFAMLITFTDLETGYTRYFGWNEGDARVAMIHDGWFTQLSTDHTIDGAPYLFFGKRDYVSGAQFSGELTLEPGQLPVEFLVYSDGLWNMLSPEQIAQICLENMDPAEAVQTLINAAITVEEPDGRKLDEKVTTGDDNTTIAIIAITAKEQ